MSVLIKGMEMPKSCDTNCIGIQYHVCPIKEVGEALAYHFEEVRHPNCPLIEVKELEGER